MAIKSAYNMQSNEFIKHSYQLYAELESISEQIDKYSQIEPERVAFDIPMSFYKVVERVSTLSKAKIVEIDAGLKKQIKLYNSICASIQGKLDKIHNVFAESYFAEVSRLVEKTSQDSPDVQKFCEILKPIEDRVFKLARASKSSSAKDFIRKTEKLIETMQKVANKHSQSSFSSSSSSSSSASSCSSRVSSSATHFGPDISSGQASHGTILREPHSSQITKELISTLSKLYQQLEAIQKALADNCRVCIEVAPIFYQIVKMVHQISHSEARGCSSQTMVDSCLELCASIQNQINSNHNEIINSFYFDVQHFVNELTRIPFVERDFQFKARFEGLDVLKKICGSSNLRVKLDKIEKFIKEAQGIWLPESEKNISKEPLMPFSLLSVFGDEHDPVLESILDKSRNEYEFLHT